MDEDWDMSSDDESLGGASAVSDADAAALGMDTRPPEFYDPEADDKDEEWVQRMRRAHRSDAILSCPLCFTTLCIDCQQHDKFENQFRAMFVMNCRVRTGEVVTLPTPPPKRGKQQRKQRGATIAGTMAPSDAVVQMFGILGGVILTAMMFPQMWQLWRTRSADDLSHVFLICYNVGMLLLVFYNLFMKLWVFVVACILQLALGVLLQGGKVWADRWQRTQRKREQGRLAKALSFRSGAKLALREFAAGGGGAPFPRLQPAPSHAMQHLLIDARVVLAPGLAGAAEQQGSVNASAAADGFAAVSSMLEASLADAGLLQQRRQQLGAAGKQQQQPSQGASNGEDHEAAETSTAFFQCQDGYVAAVWHGASASLSVDCLAASEHSMRSMTAAGEAFCSALRQRFPGSRVAASSRLWVMEQNAVLVASSSRRAAAIYRTGQDTAECCVRACDTQGTFLPRPVACITLRLHGGKGVPSLEADDRRALVLLLRAVAGEQAWFGITDRTSVQQLFVAAAAARRRGGAAGLHAELAGGGA
ncbi:E2F-associated phospho [Chlorella sorokiniana]|uniref:E2F-associated phospho n=1 Tax=Chlorella sorokiniana TaxID=3076 RepID=A0A2P6TRY6_CHLSO|nr:E2F-associated phospho [Chlorella sorokiniana]|eukprot:PRW56817.1 E2F-associated phospho [Chlorella sorokiniana]